MNLNAIAGGIVAAVNPWVSGQYRQSNGSTTAADGTRTPAYLPAVDVAIQMQMLSFKDLQQVQGLNQNGEKRAMYVDGDWRGVSRPDLRGGDLITLDADGTVWLVTQVLENWFSTGGWAKVAVTKQNGA